METTLREKAAEKVTAMKALIGLAKAEGRGLSDDEKVKFDRLKTERESLEALAAQEDEVAKLEATLDAPQGTVAGRGAAIIRAGGPEPKREFESLGEFLVAAKTASLGGRVDQRLVYRESGLAAEQSFGEAAKGGFAVPQVFLPGVRKVDPFGAVIRPRATLVNGDAGAPDAEVSYPLLNQGAAKGMQGGLSMAFVAEGATISESDAALKEGTLKPHEAAGIVTMSNKVMRNFAAISALLEQLFREALETLEEQKFLSGTGVGMPLGILNSGALKTVNRAVGSQIAIADVRKMVKGVRAAPGVVWMASRDAYDQIAALENANGSSAFHERLSEAVPDMLSGFPIFWSTRNPVLGSKGDLILADFSKYLIRDGLAPTVAFSEHSQFAKAKTQMRVIASFDGKPELDAPLPYEADSSKTYSPFVALDVPAA